MSDMFDSTVSLRDLLPAPTDMPSRCDITELWINECACAKHRNSVDDWTPPTRVIGDK